MPEALTAVLPLLSEFGQSELVLTDDVRADLQLKLMRALRAAGLEGYSS